MAVDFVRRDDGIAEDERVRLDVRGCVGKIRREQVAVPVAAERGAQMSARTESARDDALCVMRFQRRFVRQGLR